mmetsp:Transcript_20151/g.63396  ORF Transcript_20151/g.63396 Transcript_20151/m.63396 type:complete len:241 (-) Transcript_20151:1193-1915(-)
MCKGRDFWTTNGIRGAARSLRVRRRARVVGDVLLDVRQELAVERDDDAVLALLPDSLADGHVEVNRGHDAVAELLVNQELERVAVVRHGLVRPVDVGLLENLVVPDAHRRDLERVEVAGRDGAAERLGELVAAGGLELGLAQQELRRVAVRPAALVGDVVEALARRLFGREEALRQLTDRRSRHSAYRRAERSRAKADVAEAACGEQRHGRNVFFAACDAATQFFAAMRLHQLTFFGESR